MKTALIHAALVGSGGFLGALARFGLREWIHRGGDPAAFPHGTLVANLLGCFAIGALAGFAESHQLFAPEFRLFVLVGLLGGFTTFSTFGYETFAMLRETEYVRAIVNVVVHVVAGLALVWLGFVLTSGGR